MRIQTSTARYTILHVFNNI